MKKRVGLLYALAVLLISCGRHDHNTSIAYKDKDRYYSMDAHFSKSRTRAAERFMNEKIGRKSNVSFTNTRIDAQLTLDNGTTFYLYKQPGHIEVKLDKAKNTEAAYRDIKAMCEGLKAVIL